MRVLRGLALAWAASMCSLSAVGAECQDSVFPLRMANTDNVLDDRFGTAILLDSDRWLYLAPAHVVTGTERIFVLSLVELQVLFTDTKNNVALLAPKDGATMQFWINLLNREVQPVELATESPAAGEVRVCSYPLRLLTSEPSSIVPFAELEPSALDKRGFLRIRKQIQPGESGGAVLDAEHRLVGMVVTLLERNRELVYPGVAIPVEQLREALLRASD